MLAFNDNVDPYAAMNCRCVKIKITNENLQEGAFPRMPIPQYIPSIISPLLMLNSTEVKTIINKRLNVYPNPVYDILTIDGDLNQDYSYQLYNLSGEIVSEGKFINNKINISSLKAGIYLIRINNSQELTKIIKK
ncbi:T9SS type A sorting domain-containing protein [Algoriella sp.]|uniref:T9SS type A sorting domain-containing protein n=1 Tax=Algoriella sp. TaxID=1872434 RepID=UPI001B187FD3|nr:T9SS type A sorting domain-containing protein [Algoriella sp.]MBO6212036.1 T9SS type A sorting domain-containing protein [Algoriella sp.]